MIFGLVVIENDCKYIKIPFVRLLNTKNVKSNPYSYRKVFTGFCVAALYD
jgi:hypothetical protein